MQKIVAYTHDVATGEYGYTVQDDAGARVLITTTAAPHEVCEMFGFELELAEPAPKKKGKK